AASKRSDRETGAATVAFAREGDRTAGVVLESETDFVARNAEFVLFAERAAQLALMGQGFESLEEEATAAFREKAKVTKSVVLEGQVATYLHHDKSKGGMVVYTGDADAEMVRKAAIQVVAFPPEVLRKSDLSPELLAKELELETKRALDEGKAENIAKNIAQGRVNKEYVTKVVLLEQPFYLDMGKSTQAWLKENANGAEITDFAYLAAAQD
ncbi:MAG: hypothetical protein C4320_05150, partial [Armatimonadota bacterium]